MIEFLRWEKHHQIHKPLGSLLCSFTQKFINSYTIFVNDGDKMLLSIRSAGPIKLEIPKNVEISKTILYGCNNAGKTSIIRALLVLLNCRECLTVYESRRIHEFTEVFDVHLNSNTNRKPKIARMLTDKIYLSMDNESSISNNTINIEKHKDLLNILSDFKFVRKVLEFFKYLDYGISDIYYSGFREDDKWFPVELLPYSYKRILAMLYAIHNSDLTIIENFEAGLHVDLIREFIDYITENYKDKIIVLESRLGATVRFGLLRNWNVYYVSRENIEKLDIQKLQVTKIFEREIEALK